MRQVRTVGDLGAVVRAARRRINWTQAELADQAGVSRQWVVALESGQAARAELGRVLSVLAALNLPMNFPSIAPTDQSTGSRDQPWLDLDSHLASFTAPDHLPGLDDEPAA